MKFNQINNLSLSIILGLTLSLCSAVNAFSQTEGERKLDNALAVNTKKPVVIDESTAAKAIDKATSSKRKAPSSAHDWSGFYIGGVGGFNWNRSVANTSTVFSPTGYFATTSVPAIATAGRQSLNKSRFTGGATFGWNYQHGHLVAGAEVDWSWVDNNQSVSSTATYPCCAPTTFTVTQSLKNRWLLTARPRVGYAAGNTLIYGTFGYAFSDLNYQELFTDTFATARESAGFNQWKVGGVGGGGIEQKISDHWSIKGEWLYTTFFRKTLTSNNLTAFTPAISFPTNEFTHSIYIKEQSVRFGINYHF